MCKRDDIAAAFVQCCVCDAWCEESNSLATHVPVLLYSGKASELLVHFCWFCVLDVNAPLPICLSSSSNLNANHKGRTIGDEAKEGVIQP